MVKYSLLIALFVSFNLFSAEPEVKFRFPISYSDLNKISAFPIFGFDHNSEDGWFNATCTNYQGKNFPLCYDGHKGTDFMLKGGFSTMDKGSAMVVAAEAGTVVKVVDGNFDRCSVDVWRFDVSCWGHPMSANYIKIKHANGTYTRYLHLKKGSMLVKEGDEVRCGQKLALVGSSGRSSGPHLHFEVHNKRGKKLDPYRGKYSQSYSFWKRQNTKTGLPGTSCR